MSVFYRGSDLIYQVRALYGDSGDIIAVSTFTEIIATFCLGGDEVEYTLSDAGITTDDNYINIYIQRADFVSKNEGSWNLKIYTEEVDSDFASNTRVRIGEINNAFRLDEACK